MAYSSNEYLALALGLSYPLVLALWCIGRFFTAEEEIGSRFPHPFHRPGLAKPRDEALAEILAKGTYD
jgi:hypothetical protein